MTRTPSNTPTATGTPASGDITINYTYDPLYRLTAADYSTGDYYHYTYDEVGNRLTQSSAVGGSSSVLSYTYDNANRLTSVLGPSSRANYTFDANGNMTSDGVNTYTYDSANRLISINGTTTYTYSGLGDRYQQTVSGNTTTYVNDINSSLTQVLDDGTNSYSYGLGRISQTLGSMAEYFISDALGSVRLANAAAERCAALGGGMGLSIEICGLHTAGTEVLRRVAAPLLPSTTGGPLEAEGQSEGSAKAVRRQCEG